MIAEAPTKAGDSGLWETIGTPPPKTNLLDNTIALDLLRTKAGVGTDSVWAPEFVEKTIRLVTRRYTLPQVIDSVGGKTREVSRLIREVGKFLKVKNADNPTGSATHEGSMFLVPILPDLELMSELSRYQRNKSMALYEQMIEEDIPDYWSDEAMQGETLHGAVKAIQQELTSLDVNLKKVVNEFIFARYHLSTVAVSYPTMHTAWRLAQMEMLHGLALSEDTTPALAANVTAAFDTLQTFREDAVSATMQLRKLHGDDPNIERLAVRARPLLGAPVLRLERTVSHAAVVSSPTDYRQKALRAFAAEVPVSSLPQTVEEMNDGQVLNAALALGLPVDSPTRVQTRAAVTRLEEAGVTAAVSKMQSLWSVAFAAGKEDTYWDAVQKFTEGDYGWADDLQ